MGLRLSLSSSFQLTRDGEPIALKNKKAQALLIYLALTGAPQRREHLATLLWGDRFDDHARASLRQALFALRKAVGEGVVVGDDPLALATGALEIARDEASVLLPRFATGAEGFDGWLDQKRSDERAAAVAALADRARSATSAAQAVTLWRQVLALDPLAEAGQRGLMEALAADGRRADALNSYTRFAERVKRELDTTPVAETAALARNLREGRKDNPIDRALSEAAEMSARAHALIAPFDDLGGGDLASFFAAEMPSEISFRTRAINLVTILPGAMAPDAADNAHYLEEAVQRGAESIISGSARQIGGKVRVAANILSVEENAVVWNGSMIVDEVDAFEAIGQLATSVTQSLARHAGGIRHVEEIIDRLHSFLDDPKAFHTALQNFVWFAFFVRQSRDNFRQISGMVDLAAKRFPDSADVLSWKAYIDFHTGHLMDKPDRVHWYRKGREYVDRALAIDPGHMLALNARIFCSTWLGDFAAADAANHALVEMESPLHVRSGIYAVSLIFRGRLDESLPYLDRSMELERGTPLLFYRYAILGLGHCMARDHAAALVAAENAMAVSTEFFLAHLVRIAALERLGRHVDAAQAIADMRNEFRDPRVSHYQFLPIADATQKADFLGALRDAGLPG